MVFAFKGMTPVVDPTAFVHPKATLIGHVTIGLTATWGPMLCFEEIGERL